VCGIRYNVALSGEDPEPLRLSQRVIGVWLPRVAVLSNRGKLLVLVMTCGLLVGGVIGLSRQHVGGCDTVCYRCNNVARLMFVLRCRL
jgi:hypothetical protein